ncbi:MAG: hypothetical protein JWR72_1200, partial [Flavisolibacter sp.]|nr:hypothetical protein [Flavisolibacter sp.]
SSAYKIVCLLVVIVRFVAVKIVKMEGRQKWISMDTP